MSDQMDIPNEYTRWRLANSESLLTNISKCYPISMMWSPQCGLYTHTEDIDGSTSGYR